MLIFPPKCPASHTLAIPAHFWDQKLISAAYLHASDIGVNPSHEDLLGLKYPFTLLWAKIENSVYLSGQIISIFVTTE